MPYIILEEIELKLKVEQKIFKDKGLILDKYYQLDVIEDYIRSERRKLEWDVLERVITSEIKCHLK